MRTPATAADVVLLVAPVACGIEAYVVSAGAEPAVLAALRAAVAIEP